MEEEHIVIQYIHFVILLSVGSHEPKVVKVEILAEHDAQFKTHYIQLKHFMDIGARWRDDGRGLRH